MFSLPRKRMAEKPLKRYLEMKNLEGWKEYKELREKKVKKADSREERL